MLDANLLNELENLLPNKVSTSAQDLSSHGSNQFYVTSQLPDAICFAESEEDILTITNFCVKNKIPLIPYGSGTSVEGHTSPVYAGICLDLSGMNKVLEVNTIDGYVIVQPGISYNKLNEYLEPYGFHFPVEAGWGASIGGMVSTNASGAGATDSGSMLKNVLNCNVVSYQNGSATKMNVGSKTAKTSSGYNLLSLFVGAEGTLGVISEVCLKIRRNFSYYKTLCCQFNEIEDAIKFISAMKGTIQFRKAELLDKLQTEACVLYSDIKTLYKNKVTLLIELAGNEAALSEDIKIMLDYLNKNQVECVKVYTDKKSAEPIWMMRKQACPAAIQFIGKDKKAMATDICVPLSKLNECIQNCYEKMKLLGIKSPLVAHVADGNFHFTIIFDNKNIFELERAKEFSSYVVTEALKVGGTCSGEHGIGLGKKDHLQSEHHDSIFMMESIKLALDPLGIFNPGKVLNFQSKLSYGNTSKENVSSCSQVQSLPSFHVC